MTARPLVKVPTFEVRRLGAVASILLQLIRSHDEGAEADAGFDSGEWSGPEHERALWREAEEVVEMQLGVTLPEFFALVEERTSARWLHFSELARLDYLPAARPEDYL